MSNRKQELKDSIEDLRDKLSRFENELEELTILDLKKDDIVRIISDSPTRFTIGSPFVIGAYCKVISVGGYDHISIKLHKSVYYDTNTCEEGQVELVWSS